MAKKTTKRPEYDGNACMLYDFMVSQGLTEEIIAQEMGLDAKQEKIVGKEYHRRAPWQLVAGWIQNPNRIPHYYMLSLYSAMNAPLEAMFIKSRLLNGLDFPFYWHAGEGGQKLEDTPSAELIKELRLCGYKVYKEV